MGRVFVFALTSALNPTLLAAVTVMLTQRNPRRLLLGYLLGALLTSLTCGLLLVFSLHSSGAASTAKHTINPVANIALGVLLAIAVILVRTGHDTRRREWSNRRRVRHQDKSPPRWRTLLSEGSVRDTLLVGVLLSFPGASYIAGMNLLSKQHLSTAGTLLAVLAFNVVQLVLLELPLLGFAIRPQWTAVTVERFNRWLHGHGREVALNAATALSIALLARGIVNW